MFICAPVDTSCICKTAALRSFHSFECVIVRFPRWYRCSSFQWMNHYSDASFKSLHDGKYDGLLSIETTFICCLTIKLPAATGNNLVESSEIKKSYFTCLKTKMDFKKKKNWVIYKILASCSFTVCPKCILFRTIPPPVLCPSRLCNEG